MNHTRWIAVAAGALLAAACAQTKSEKPTAAEKPAAVEKVATVEKAEANEGHETELPVQKVAAAQKTSLADAIAAALAKTPGDALEAALEGEIDKGTQSVFIEVMVLDAHGDAIEVKVDPADGKILSAAKEDEEDEAEELTALAKKLPSGHLSLGELVRRAEPGPDGKIVAAGFLVSKEHGAVGVVRFLVGEELHQVTLDAKTAAVLTKKTLKQEDDDEDEDDEDEAKEHAGKK